MFRFALPVAEGATIPFGRSEGGPPAERGYWPVPRPRMRPAAAPDRRRRNVGGVKRGRKHQAAIEGRPKLQNGLPTRSEAANAVRGLCREAKRTGGPRPASEGMQTNSNDCPAAAGG